MPYVDLPNTHDDYASLWYITNSPTGTVGGFDPAKATIVLLHPAFLDSAWLTLQFEDPRLTCEYNLIAFDARHAGRTRSRLNPAQDGWTDAADLAFALQVLCIPVFPDMCLSLTLLSVPSDPNDSFDNLNEIIQSWCYAQELDTIEHAFMNMVTTFCGPILEDDLIAHLEVHYPPFRRVICERASPNLLSRIVQPVLIIHGDSNEVFLPEAAFNMQEQLINVKDGAKLFFIRGAKGCLSVVPECASISNRVFAFFLATLPTTPSNPHSFALPLADAMRRLAEIVHDPEISKRKPSSPMAFSCVPPEVLYRRAEIYAGAAPGHRGAFSPLNDNGRPQRRYSERVLEQWFEVDRYGMSYSAQSEEGRMRRCGVTLDERFDLLSQKLLRELPVARLRRAVPRVPPPAIERMALASSFPLQRIANTASLASRTPISSL
ncbi:alpha/beta-hydrolase [Lactarius akahatsu]|uniref:Alpha/beta-hydrolase n=1 Tax=Lactarius akahatsu TaxID=416441 RepID=A0AAD4LCJ1_9AGAM|nr:alpha/beta-hydrolase [Lactarius akahatsu]